MCPPQEPAGNLCETRGTGSTNQSGLRLSGAAIRRQHDNKLARLTGRHAPEARHPPVLAETLAPRIYR